MFTQATPHRTLFKRAWVQAGFLWLGLQAITLSAQAQGMPEISPSLKKMLGGLPIDEVREQVQGMVGALQKTSCGGGLTGCYATQSGPLQLYFFTSQSAQQTFLLVIDKKMPMPHLLKDNVQKVFGGTSLSMPMVSISTAEFTLDAAKMPPALQKIVRDRYFNVGSLSFASGVQLAARADLGGGIKMVMQSMGAPTDQLTMRAAVVMPIPTDLAGGAGSGAGMADAMRHGDTMKKAGADALSPEAFVEIQFPPNATLNLATPRLVLTDATFFINNALTFGYKGNAAFPGVPNKKTILHFQTPLTPLGVMDLADFQFLMATPPNLTMEDAAHMMVAMATPDPRLARHGGGFIKNIESYKNTLLTVTQPLSVFKLKNPVPHPEYRFADSTKPFPNDWKYFNFILAGPLVDGGPLLKAAGDMTILGQKMGSLDALADGKGFNGKAMEDISVKLGPLGKVTIQKIIAEAHVDGKSQFIRLKGNYYGQVVEVILDGAKLTINVPANCVNPFEIKTSVSFHEGTNIAEVFEGQGGVNVDPSKIAGCIGKELEAALRKIAGEYKHLSGYTAQQANEALKQMSGTAEYVAAQTQKQAEAAAAEAKKQADAAAAQAEKQAQAARKEYERAKDAARDVASKTSNAANNAFNEAGNAFKRLGKKKKHKKGPDPKFAGSVFDWDYYYDNAPDVVKAKVDLATHWRDNGFNEGRQGSPEFNARFYWGRYLDVQARCSKTDLQCALQHWLDQGLQQGRQGSANFSIASYLARYPDLQRAFGRDNYEDAFDHWVNNGEDENRSGAPDWSSNGAISGPVRVGGGGGGAWTDFDQCDGQYVDGFRLRSGKTVDTVQFRYANKGWAPRQGAGGDGYSANVTLPSGEYIVRVDYRSGSRIDQLKFTTNRGKTYGPYGGGGGSPGTYNVTPGEKLGCMAGRSGSSTDQLTFSSTGPR